MYETVREYIGDIENKTVFDLFSGTGTIGQVLAPVAKKVIGVEIIEEAVEAAKENALRNGLSNCKFIAGDVFKVLDEIEEKPDVIVLIRREMVSIRKHCLRFLSMEWTGSFIFPAR